MIKQFILLFLLISFNASAQYLETYAGSGLEGLLNGPALDARFTDIEQTVSDQAGNLYIADTGNNVIRKIDIDGEVTTFAGTGTAGDQLGPKESARFNRPSGVAIGSDGSLYVVDKDNHKIKVIRPDGMVEFVAGSGIQGFADGPADQCQFDFPTYLCVDEFDNLFVAGNNDNRIRKIDQMTQVVSTFAGNNIQGYQDGVGEEASFFLPQGIAIDQDNNLYVGDRNNNVIRKITPDQVVTTLAGALFVGHNDGPADQALFSGPKGVAVDSAGNVYVADRLNFVVRKIDTNGMVSTIAGTPGFSGNADGAVSDGTLIGRAVSVACHPDGSLMISDWENTTIRRFGDMSTHVFEPTLPANESISLVPNPTSNFVQISGVLGNDYETTLFSVHGKLILKLKNQSQLDLKEVPPGIYLLQISGKNYFNAEKLIVY